MNFCDLLQKHGYVFENEKLGKGQFGDVWKISKDGKFFAAKCVWYLCEAYCNKEGVEKSISECLSISNKYLVNYVEMFRYEYEGRIQLVIVMDYCMHSLPEFVNRLRQSDYYSIPHEQSIKIMKQMLQGLSDLHQGEKIHGNIKPNNVFVDEDNNVKMSDYGFGEALVKRFGDFNSVTDIPFCVAPEIFDGEPLSKAADVWSLGVVFYFLCMGSFPFLGDRWEIQEVIAEGTYTPIPQTACEAHARVMIDSMLNKDYSKRPLAKNLLQQLMDINTEESVSDLSYE